MEKCGVPVSTPVRHLIFVNWLLVRYGWIEFEFGRHLHFAVEIRTNNPNGLVLIDSTFDFQSQPLFAFKYL